MIFRVTSILPVRCFPFHLFFFFNDAATTEIYTLSLHDALPICCFSPLQRRWPLRDPRRQRALLDARAILLVQNQAVENGQNLFAISVNPMQALAESRLEIV